MALNLRALSYLVVIAACADHQAPTDPTGGNDLPLGDLSDSDLKADGAWGHALECKPIPDLPQLIAPHITVSLEGLTLHLTDPASSYDRVFPIGPGAVDATTTDLEFGESLSYYPVLKTGGGDFTITPSSTTPCKTWWTDPDTGEKIPVFAGLPFMSWFGNYAIHGPVDNYRAANGGALRRGYVSHGCIRMEAADVLEVYGRIKDVAKVTVHVQRARERNADNTIVDLPAKWVGSACTQDSDCDYADGFCATNRYSERGFCSARCTQFCTDRPGYPSTFCVADPDAAGQGMCVAKAVAQNYDCRPYESFAVAAAQPRLNQPSVKADVCLPGSQGWVGDHCLADADCKNGTTCLGATADKAGICSMACALYCSDEPGEADTFCAAGGNCERQCTPSSNGAECPSDMACGTAARNGQPGTVRNVCQ